MASSRAEEFREAIRTARSALETAPNNPFKLVLEDVVAGLTDQSVEAHLAPGAGGRWTLALAPAHQPARSTSMLTVVITEKGAEVLSDPPRIATTPEQFTDIMRAYITTPAFLESLQAISELAAQPVEGYLRVAPNTVSREDLMLEVPPEVQRQIAQSVGQGIVVRLSIARFPGAGIFRSGTPYKVFESAGFSVFLSEIVTQDEAGNLHIAGRVARASSDGSVFKNLSDEELSAEAQRLARDLRDLKIIYERDRDGLEKSPDEETRRKAVTYASTVTELQNYIRSEYTTRSSVRVRECKREFENRLRGRMPAVPPVDFTRPADLDTDIDQIADLMERAALILTPRQPGR